MNELDKKIREITPDIELKNIDILIIKRFISKCSLSEFEKLKDLEYDISLNEKVG